MTGRYTRQEDRVDAATMRLLEQLAGPGDGQGGTGAMGCVEHLFEEIMGIAPTPANLKAMVERMRMRGIQVSIECKPHLGSRADGTLGRTRWILARLRQSYGAPAARWEPTP